MEMQTDSLFGFAVDADENVVDVYHIRDLTAAETAQSRGAEVLLRKVTIGSALSELHARERSLDEAIEVLKATSASNSYGSGARVQSEFKAWLSAFRSFEDRTSAWLSAEIGKEVCEEFKRRLSAEFDCNFAYRLCCSLRNVSEHAGDVLNDMRWTSRRTADGVGVETVLVLRFDGPRLARDFTKIKAPIREELRHCGGPLEFELIVGAATLSCERVHLGLLLALWGTVEPAIRVCQSLHDEALANGSGEALFMPTDSLGGLGPGRPGQMTMRSNAKSMGDLALHHRAEAEIILGQPVSPLRAQDFME